MAKTACEEAAEALEMRNFPPALPKRLRAEGRELRRLRREREKSVLIPRYLADFLLGSGPLEGVYFGEKSEGIARGNFWWRHYFPSEHAQPKARIQKARKAK